MTNLPMLPKDDIPLSQQEYRERILLLIDDMNSKFIERDELVRLLILTIFCAEHALLIGVPGTAKTDFVGCIFTMILEATVFEKLLDTGTLKEEVFGNAALDFETMDKSETILGNHFIFVDEVGRARGSLLETFLKVLNERQYQSKGRAYDIPLSTCVGASNSLLTGEEMDAVDDRFPIRYEVLPIQRKENLIRYFRGEFDTSRKLKVKFRLCDIANVKNSISSISTNEDFDDLYYRVRQEMLNNKIRISDRKIGKAIKILKASAFLNGRQFADYSDFFILNHICWTRFEDIPKINRIIYEMFFQNSDDIDRMFMEAEDELKSVIAEINNSMGSFLKYEYEQDDFTSKLELAYENIIGTTSNFIIKALGEIYEKFLEIESKKKFADHVLSQVQDNIFVVNIEDNTFTEDIIARYQRNMNEIIGLFNAINNWRSLNGDYYSFQRNCLKK